MAESVAVATAGDTVQSTEVSDTADQCPQIWHVGSEDRSGAFSHVPICPFTSERIGEGIVLVEDGAEDDKRAQAEYTNNGYLFTQRQLRLDEHWKCNSEYKRI